MAARTHQDCNFSLRIFRPSILDNLDNLISLSLAHVSFEWLITFLFGLVHGFGFASVLADLGLPQGALALSLVGFNVGVELGQLFVIGVAFLLVGAWFGRKRWYRPVIAVPASAAIAFAGLWWFAERTFLA